MARKLPHVYKRDPVLAMCNIHCAIIGMSPVFITISLVLLASIVVGDDDSYCPKPEVPTNGYISRGRQNYYRVGNRVEYACKSGYKLWGEKRIRCVKNGEVEYWDDPAPECKKGM